MSEAIPRRYPYINDLIEHMDQRLAEVKGVVSAVLDDLTPDEQRAIDTELLKVSGPDPASMRYFLENYFVINTKGGEEGSEWEPQRLQTIYPFKESQEIVWEDLVYCWEHRIAMWWIMLKARQVSWSTLIQACMFQRTIFNKLMRVLVMADEMDRAHSVFDMSQLAYNYLPYWMRPEKHLDNRGQGIVHFDRKDDEERIIRPGLNSWFHVDAANKPTGSSRGKTLHGAHMSEAGMYTRPQIITSDILPAVAKKNPLVICVVEGTAKLSGSGAGGRFYQRMWELAYSGRGKFRPLFCGWYKEKAYSKPFLNREEEETFELTKEEIELAKKIKDESGFVVSKAQMRWRREEAEQFEATEGDADQFEQEYPSYAKSAFRSGGICAFPRKKLGAIEVRDVRKPLWVGELVFKEVDGKDQPVFVQWDMTLMKEAPLWIWEWPNSKDVYYEASDPSHGIPGKDYAALQIFRAPVVMGERIRQCLEYQGYASPSLLSKIACTLGYFYNTAEMAPECNTLTEHIGNILRVQEYPKIYRWRRPDKTTGHFTNFFGWETNHKSREDLIARFRQHMVGDSLEIKSQRLLDECQAFVDDGSGRYEAGGGAHDDVLFAAMICVYCLLELDPNLLNRLAEERIDPDGKKRDFANTDHSMYDNDTEPNSSDFSML